MKLEKIYVDFKTFVLENGLSINYTQNTLGYDLIAYDGYKEYVCTITDSGDISDFENTYKSSANGLYIQNSRSFYTNKYQLETLNQTDLDKNDWTIINNYLGSGYLEVVYLDFSTNNVSVNIEIDGITTITGIDLSSLASVEGSLLPIYCPDSGDFVFRPSKIIRFNNSVKISAYTSSNNKKFNTGYFTVIKD